MKSVYSYMLFVCLLAVVACKKHPSCDSFFTVAFCPYSDAIWHPSGQVIGFNHTPLKSIDYSGSGTCSIEETYETKQDSAGFWLINADGTNQRRILPYTLVTPSWSSDGKWLAFANGGDIFKMPFDGQKLDTNSIVRLTFSGNNYSPTWNYQSSKIAYSKSVCNGPNTCGVWLYDSTNPTNPNQFIATYGFATGWFHNIDSFLYYTSYINTNGVMLGDSVWTYSQVNHGKQFLKAITTPYVDDRLFQASPDDSKIAFTAQSNIPNGGIQICTINIDGSNFKQLTTEGTTGFSWAPDGRIVYVKFDYVTTDQSHGVLWIMNADGSNKKQLTYNSGYTIKQY